MDIETIRDICQKLTGTTTEIKWENDLVFSIGAKMFCVIGLDQTPTSASFKVLDEQFEEICNLPGCKPAPYLAKHKWVLVDDISKMTKTDWEKHLKQSYALIQEKLSAKMRKQLGIL